MSLLQLPTDVARCAVRAERASRATAKLSAVVMLFQLAVVASWFVACIGWLAS
jgi:hypothetical protein